MQTFSQFRRSLRLRNNSKTVDNQTRFYTHYGDVNQSRESYPTDQSFIAICSPNAPYLQECWPL